MHTQRDKSTSLPMLNQQAIRSGNAWPHVVVPVVDGQDGRPASCLLRQGNAKPLHALFNVIIATAQILSNQKRTIVAVRQVVQGSQDVASGR